MNSLPQTLQATPWRLLLIIGRQRGLGLNANLTKADLIAKVGPLLSDPDNIAVTCQGLSPSAQGILTNLTLAGGRLPVRHLQPGAKPPLTQTGLAKKAQSQTAPLSPLEQLLVSGLVFFDPHALDFFIPTELRPYLRRPELPGQPAISSGSGPAPIDLLCHDLTCLLALLQRDQISLLHGRWLPPHFLQLWGHHCAGPLHHPNARSELQTGRRRFLHYLAESAGFVTGPGSLVTGQAKRKRPFYTGRVETYTGRVETERETMNNETMNNEQLADDKKQRTNDQGPGTMITPAAWLWLNAPREQRLKTLWQAWLMPVPERWQRFRWPGAAWLDNPLRLLEPLHQALLEIDAADPALFAQTLLKQHPHLQDLAPAGILNRTEVVSDVVIELLTGPLVWLGVLSNDERGMMNDEGGMPVLSEVEGMKDEEFHRSSLAGQGLILHHSGHALLAGKSPPDDDSPDFAKFSIKNDIQSDALESSLTLTLSNGLPEPRDLMTALEVGSREFKRSAFAEVRRETEQQVNILPPTPYSLILTPISFILALHRGWSLPALLDALNRLAERPLTGQETARYRSPPHKKSPTFFGESGAFAFRKQLWVEVGLGCPYAVQLLLQLDRATVKFVVGDRYLSRWLTRQRHDYLVGYGFHS